MFDGWTFLAGLGIFLFGIFMMEEFIRLLAGRSLKTLIRRFTGTRTTALFTGIFSTAVLQSSSAVSLMVLAFVGAGLLTLGNAIAVVLTTLFAGVIDFGQAAAMVIGANVGTTVTILIGAIGGIPAKKQTALSSLVFKTGTALVMLPILTPALWIIGHFFDPVNNAVPGIVISQS